MSKSHINNPYRKIYKEHYGEIPKGHHIHHIDFNAYNNDPSNLIALTPEEHAKIHNHDGVNWCSTAGKIGGRVSYNKMSDQERRQWHSKGGKTSAFLKSIGEIKSGGWSMSDTGKNNIRESRMKTPRIPCPYGCVTKRGNTHFDAGNYKLHMEKVHSNKEMGPK